MWRFGSAVSDGACPIVFLRSEKLRALSQAECARNIAKPNDALERASIVFGSECQSSFDILECELGRSGSCADTLRA